MKKLFVCIAVAVCMLFPAAISGEEVVNILPEDTLLYGMVDVEKALSGSQEYCKFVDGEIAGNVVFQIKAIHKALKEFAARYEFTPGIFDHLHELKAHFILMKKDEPEVKKHTFKSPKYNHETGEIIQGEFEEHSYTETNYVAFLTAFETTEELAEDFIDQFKGLMGRMAEKYPKRREEFVWKELESEKGELLSFEKGSFVIGRMGGYIVVSPGNPKEIQRYFISPADPALGSMPIHQRNILKEKPPIGFLLSSIRALTVLLEESLTLGLKNAMEEAAKKKQGGEQQMQDWRVQRAQASLNRFLMFKKAIGFDTIRMGGVYTDMSISDNTASSSMNMTIELSESASPLIRLALNSGKPFEAPNLGDFKGVCLMMRIGFKQMLDETLKALPPQYTQAFNGQVEMAKQSVGLDIPGLIAQLSGDIYVLIDIIPDKEIPTQSYNYETKKIETNIVKKTVPEFFILFGLNDSGAASEMLSKLFTSVSTKFPQAASLVKKRVYQGTDVYLFGSGIDREDAQPDGFMSYAAVILGRHFTMGSWEKVTGFIRRVKSDASGGSKIIADAIARHKDASFLCVFPKAFMTKIENMMQKKNEDPLGMIIKQWENMQKQIPDKELAEQLKTPVKKLLESVQALQKKASKPETAVVSGTLKGNFYDVHCRSEVRK